MKYGDKISTVDHLTELRKRLILSLVFFIVSFIVSLLWSADIYKFLTSNFNNKLIVLGPNDILWIYLTLAGLCLHILDTIYLLSNLGIYKTCIRRKRSSCITSLYTGGIHLFFSRISFRVLSSNSCYLKCASFYRRWFIQYSINSSKLSIIRH